MTRAAPEPRPEDAGGDAGGLLPESRIVEVGGRRLHAWVAGDGPTIVLLHGASGNLRDFTYGLGPRLARDFRVVAFDRPGLGLSEGLGRGRESPAEQAALLSRAAEALEVERAVIVGHSYGGSVAMAWALNHRDQAGAVVSLAGAVQPWKGGLGPFYTLTSTRIGGATLVPLIASLTPSVVVRNSVASIFAPDPVPPGYLDHVRAELTLRAEVLRANARQVNGLKPHVIHMSPHYETLDLPIEILHGSADDIVPLHVHSAPLAAQAPGATLTVLEGVGHMPHHADPDATVAAIHRAATRAGLR